jgi:two-component system phosphate regulon response regulator PhoB
MDVELRNADGVAFLRKTTPNRQSAKNEAAVLRLFLDEQRRSLRSDRTLKPFVLLVEDDVDSRDGLAEVMRSVGMRVLAVGLGRDGLRLAQELMPDLILLDHRLPDLTGIDICRQLRANSVTASIPIVVVTASPETITKDNAADPPDVVLAKPCGFDTIVATSRLLLRDLIALADASGAH